MALRRAELERLVNSCILIVRPCRCFGFGIDAGSRSALDAGGSPGARSESYLRVFSRTSLWPQSSAWRKVELKREKNELGSGPEPSGPAAVWRPDVAPDVRADCAASTPLR